MIGPNKRFRLTAAGSSSHRYKVKVYQMQCCENISAHPE